MKHEEKEWFDSLERITSIDPWQTSKELETFKGSPSDSYIIERKVLSLRLNHGTLVSDIQLPNETGDVVSTLEFNEEEYEYIKKRIKETKNCWLVSRYAHLLWQQTKHNQHGNIAIDGYLICINAVSPSEVFELAKLLIAILTISKAAKIKTDDVKSTLSKAMNQVAQRDLHVFMTIALEYKIFNPEERHNFRDKMINASSNGEERGYHEMKTYLETIISIDKSLNQKSLDVYEKLAENEDQIIRLHNDEDFIKKISVDRQASFYLKAENKTKYDECLVESTRLKTTIKLGNVQIPLEEETVRTLTSYINGMSNALKEQETAELLAFFACEDFILGIGEESQNRDWNPSLARTFTNYQFDINSNQKEVKDSGIFDLNGISYQAILIQLFVEAFYQGIMDGRITYYRVADFLNNCTWFGQPFERSIDNEESESQHQWIALLAPGLHNYFSQYEASILMQTNRINNFILSIDSLTLKFEGALRHFVQLCGGHTMRPGKHQDFEEMLLDELLEHDIVREYFSTSDITFFKHVFTRSGNGLNLRNDVAHSFLLSKDYSYNKATLVIISLLRLGKYQFRIKRQGSDKQTDNESK